MDTRNNDFDFDFTPIGQAIKKARTAKGMTREQLARIVDYDPRHLQAIENEGQKPSLELFIQLVTMFGVSVDEYIFPDNEVKRSSVRRRLDAELDKLNDKELSIVEATVSGLCNPACERVDFHAVELAVLHTFGKQTKEIACTAGRLQDIAL